MIINDDWYLNLTESPVWDCFLSFCIICDSTRRGWRPRIRAGTRHRRTVCWSTSRSATARRTRRPRRRRRRRPMALRRPTACRPRNCPPALPYHRRWQTRTVSSSTSNALALQPLLPPPPPPLPPSNRPKSTSEPSRRPRRAPSPKRRSLDKAAACEKAACLPLPPLQWFPVFSSSQRVVRGAVCKMAPASHSRNHNTSSTVSSHIGDCGVETSSSMG